MAYIHQIPTELRQHILSLALPDVNHIGQPLPETVRDLMRISHRLRLDMGPVLDTWSPIHHVALPNQIRNLKAQTVTISGRGHGPKLERLSLHLFHESKAQHIHSTYFLLGPTYWSQERLITRWIEAVPYLPLSLSELHLDVTPAPADIRSQHALIINRFIHDKRTQHFLGDYTRDAGDLVQSINMRYTDRIHVQLTGKLSRRSEFFLTYMQSKSEIALDFVGTWITTDDAHFASINAAAQRVARYQKLRQTKQQRREYQSWQLRDVTWSKSTVWAYAKVAYDGEEEAAIRDLRTLADFMVDSNRFELRMGPVESVRRELQHRMAEDMNLKTISEGDGGSRHVVVTKT